MENWSFTHQVEYWNTGQRVNRAALLIVREEKLPLFFASSASAEELFNYTGSMLGVLPVHCGLDGEDIQYLIKSTTWIKSNIRECLTYFLSVVHWWRVQGWNIFKIILKCGAPSRASSQAQSMSGIVVSQLWRDCSGRWGWPCTSLDYNTAWFHIHQQQHQQRYDWSKTHTFEPPSGKQFMKLWAHSHWHCFGLLPQIFRFGAVRKLICTLVWTKQAKSGLLENRGSYFTCKWTLVRFTHIVNKRIPQRTKEVMQNALHFG